MTEVAAVVQAVFRRTRNELVRRVETVEQAVAAMLAGSVDEDLRARAERDAHKLAGSLGMFGLPRGSELARELEQALGAIDDQALSEAPRLAELVLALRSELEDAGDGSDDDEHADPAVSDGRAVLLVSPDPALTERLSAEALTRHLRPQSAASPAGARHLVATELPDAAVLDLNFSGGAADGLALLADLAASEPLLLDLDMPELDGIDLCRAVRADIRFGQLPVVFLTARADADSVQRIFEAGADDYVRKPIVGPELVTRIRNRLDRIRLLRELAEQDFLTGVASRRKSTEALENLIAMANRFGQPLSIALIDLDHFKQLNDRLGHATGDAVLRRIGAVLAGAFRGEDVIGRWGGEEFVVGTYGMVREDGIRRMTELLESFRAEGFTGRDGLSAVISFSAGVAELPRDGRTLDDLYRAADEALYRAKGEGRNRVLPAGG